MVAYQYEYGLFVGFADYEIDKHFQLVFDCVPVVLTTFGVLDQFGRRRGRGTRSVQLLPRVNQLWQGSPRVV